jgi:hypothetical protein
VVIPAHSAWLVWAVVSAAPERKKLPGQDQQQQRQRDLVFRRVI